MTKFQYIQIVLHYVDNRRAFENIKDELEAHIDDRTEYYTNAGYDEKTAQEKAMEHLGNPQAVGYQMNKLHRDHPPVGIYLLLAFLYMGTGFLALLSYMICGGSPSLSIFTVMMEMPLLITVVLSLLLTVKKGKPGVAVFSLACYCICMIPNITADAQTYASPFIYLIYSIFSGDIGNYGAILWSFNQVHVDLLGFHYVSIIFHTFIFALIVATIIVVSVANKRRKSSPKLATTKLNTILKIAMCVVCAISVAQIVCTYTYPGKGNPSVEQIIIHESDTKCSLDNKNITRTYLRGYSGFDTYYYTPLSVYNSDVLSNENIQTTDYYEDFNDHISFKKMDSQVSYQPTKKYVFVEICKYNETPTDYSQMPEWVSTDNAFAYNGSLEDNGEMAVNTYTINFEKKQ